MLISWPKGLVLQSRRRLRRPSFRLIGGMTGIWILTRRIGIVLEGGIVSLCPLLNRPFPHRLDGENAGFKAVADFIAGVSLIIRNNDNFHVTHGVLNRLSHEPPLT